MTAPSRVMPGPSATAGTRGTAGVPLIGVAGQRLAPGSLAQWNGPTIGLPSAYMEALVAAGGLPMMLGYPCPVPAAEVCSRLDGLVLAGGGDVDPAAYGQAADGDLRSVDPERDRFELDVLAAALDQGVPVLAICRGFQVMNVAFGGTLHQELAGARLPGAAAAGPASLDQVGEPGGASWPVAHEDRSSPEGAWHPVAVEAGSLLAKATGTLAVERCASRHHQGISRLGEGLEVVATSSDGLVEAVEVKGEGFAVGVQWHPETSAMSDVAQLGIFEALVEAARGG